MLEACPESGRHGADVAEVAEVAKEHWWEGDGGMGGEKGRFRPEGGYGGDGERSNAKLRKRSMAMR